MKSKMVDISKLQTPINFAKKKGVSRQRVYLLIEQGKLDAIEIDGTKFIVVNSEINKLYRKHN